MDACCSDQVATQAGLGEPPTGRMVIKRACRAACSAIKFKVLVDGNEVGMLPNGESLSVLLPVGIRSVSAVPTFSLGVPATAPVSVTVNADEAILLRLELGFGGFTTRLKVDDANSAAPATSQTKERGRTAEFRRRLSGLLSKELIGPATLKKIQIGFVLLLILAGGLAMLSAKSKARRFAKGSDRSTQSSTHPREVIYEDVIDGQRFEVTVRRRDFDVYGLPVKPDAEVSPQTHKIVSMKRKP